MYPNVYGISYDPPDPNFPFLDADAAHRGALYIAVAKPVKDSLTSDSNVELKLLTGPVAPQGAGRRSITACLSERARSGSAYRLHAVRSLRTGLYRRDPAGAFARSRTCGRASSGSMRRTRCGSGRGSRSLGLRQDYVTSDVVGSPAENTRATTGRAGLMYELPFGLTPYVSYATSFTPVFGSGVCLDGICKAQQGEMVELGFKYNPIAGHRDQRRDLRHHREEPAGEPIPAAPCSRSRPARCGSAAPSSR